MQSKNDKPIRGGLIGLLRGTSWENLGSLSTYRRRKLFNLYLPGDKTIINGTYNESRITKKSV